MKYRKSISCVLSGMLAAMLLAGCGGNYNTGKPQITVDAYSMRAYETTTVQKGDIAPVLSLNLQPDEYTTTNYRLESENDEIDKINVSVGDKVNAGDVMVSFKSEDIQDLIDTYETQKSDNELLIEHYMKLMEIDSSQDYTAEIESLREDTEIASLYLEEQNEKLSEYNLIAEKSGTVTFVSDNLQWGYAPAQETLVTVASGSSNYTADTDDDYDFVIGETYQAEFGIATYDMKLVEITEYVDAATGKDMRTLLFEPLSDMTGLSESDTIVLEIHKPVIENVVYVDKNAVFSVEDKQYVYLVNEEGYRVAKEVTQGTVVDDVVIIESGLEGGEQVTLN